MLSTPLDPKRQDFRLWLQKEFTDRTRRNGRFSLRAFARLLDMSPSSVSQLMSGKRRCSDRIISRICDQLSTPPDVRFQLLGHYNPMTSESQSFHQITMDAFAVIADWYHYAILELTFTEDFQSSPKWIAKRLSISPAEAAMAIERLMRLELLEDRDGQLRKTHVQLTNGLEGMTGPALKELQRQVLQKALNAIDHTPQPQKDITSMTMAIDPKKLPEAKKKIAKFRRELCAYLEEGERTQVYNLGIQLYPLSQSTQENSHEDV